MMTNRAETSSPDSVAGFEGAQVEIQIQLPQPVNRIEPAETSPYDCDIQKTRTAHRSIS